MRKTIQFGIIIAFFLGVMGVLTSCQIEPTPLTYLQLTSAKEQIIKQSETYDLKFFAINPTPNTFTGTIEYQYDKDCLSTSFASDDIEITPQQYRQAIIKTFSYNQYGATRTKENCLQNPLRINVAIKDKGGETKDSFDVFLTIAEQ
jgi:hypothetical protein